jgi:predicted signal transduction protein with EAL and GGDEF domain
VETAAQLAHLQEQQCPEGQGYYFSRPVIAEEVPALLRQGTPGFSDPNGATVGASNGARAKPKLLNAPLARMRRNIRN